MEIQRATATAEVVALLRGNDLPVDDLRDPAIELLAALDGGRLLGVVGLQWLDGTALLRSLAVEPTGRDRGVGAKLCEAAERAARERGLASLWLLTTSAREYFARRGYEVAPRDEAPVSVRATAQFTSLCPSTAVVMRRSL
jgi:amino-acid N-acetyltransferase